MRKFVGPACRGKCLLPPWLGRILKIDVLAARPGIFLGRSHLWKAYTLEKAAPRIKQFVFSNLKIENQQQWLKTGCPVPHWYWGRCFGLSSCLGAQHNSVSQAVIMGRCNRKGFFFLFTPNVGISLDCVDFWQRFVGHRGKGRRIVLTFNLKPMAPDAILVAWLCPTGPHACWVQFCAHLLLEIVRFIIALPCVLLITAVLLVVLSKEPELLCRFIMWEKIHWFILWDP